MPLFGPPDISKLTRKRDVKALSKALAHQDKDVRSQAADALGTLCDARAVEPLVRALGYTSDPNLHASAATALGNIGDHRAVEPLIGAMQRSDFDFEWLAATAALAKLGDARAVEPLATELRSGLTDAAAHAAVATLEACGGLQAVVDTCVATLEGGDARGQDDAARALVDLAGRDQPGEVDPWLAAMGSARAEARAAACRALGTLGDPSTAEALAGALADESGDVRSRAARALRQLGDERGTRYLAQVGSLVSAGADGTVRLWDTRSGAHLVLDGHTKPVNACAFSPDGRRIASASDDGTIRVWDADTGECIHVLDASVGGVRACTFSADGRRIASGDVNGLVRVWSAETEDCLQEINRRGRVVNACAFSPDGRRIATASNETLELWDAAADQVPSPPPEPGHPPFEPFFMNWAKYRDSGREIIGQALACAFSPDATRIACVIRNKWGDAYLLSADDLYQVELGPGPSPGVHGPRFHVPSTARLTACAFNPDGSRIIFATEDGAVIVCDPTSGDVVTTLKGHNGSVNACTFSADGSEIASAGHDGTVKIRNTETGRTVRTLKGHTKSVLACAFNPSFGSR